jgi:hypothetical protein
MVQASSRKQRRFTYGDQFEPSRTPLINLLELSVANQRAAANQLELFTPTDDEGA